MNSVFNVVLPKFITEVETRYQTGQCDQTNIDRTQNFKLLATLLCQGKELIMFQSSIIALNVSKPCEFELESKEYNPMK